jgi:predicted acetyltransferase
MNTFPIRPVTGAEWPDFARVAEEAFNLTTPPPLLERYRAVTEFDRTLGVFDRGEIVGSAGVVSFTMTLPGGPAPVAGVTAVAVLPSHRRRGILSALMRRQLDDLHEGGEAVAALYASEAGIYGRFGYGRASDTMFFRIPTRGSQFVPDAPVDEALRLRVATPAEVRKEVERVYDAAMAQRPGHYARTAARWDAILGDEDFDRGGAGRLRCLLAEDDAGTRGYALFRVKNSWTDHDVSESELRLQEINGIDPAAYALVWRGVLDRDLVAWVKVGSRPVDDPLIHLLAEPRVLTAGWLDDLWVRLVDVGRALPQRAYSAPVDVVIEVSDPVCPWNGRRWRLAADETGSTCEATTAPADLALPVTVLGAGYLGGRPLHALAMSGAVREATPGALRRLSTAMSWEPRPWCGLVF